MLTTEQAVYDAAIYKQALAMAMPEPVAKNIVAQARFETADYTNKAFVLNNNAFGYKTFKGAKWQIGSGNVSTEGDTYARYASIQDSTGELVSWLLRREAEHRFSIASLISPVCYANALKGCAYYGASAKDYAAGIEKKLTILNWQLIKTLLITIKQ